MTNFIDKAGNPVTREEAMDERGILRAGYGVRSGILDSIPARSGGRMVFHDAGQNFADSANGRAALAREQFVAELNGREPRTAVELFADGQAAEAHTATRAAMVIGDAASARTAAMSARDKMIADFNGDRT